MGCPTLQKLRDLIESQITFVIDPRSAFRCTRQCTEKQSSELKDFITKCTFQMVQFHSIVKWHISQS